ncbi:MAG: potassium channel family protein [Caulobacterales bacterium]
MSALIGSPLRNLAAVVAFLMTVTLLATLAYMADGWSFLDAFYMVILTIYTVGFREVHPIEGVYLRTITLGVMFLGCTGMILMTGALVQVFTATEIRNLLGSNRLKSDIDRLSGHIVVCGFGRIGGMLARELADGGAPFAIIERDEKRAEEARKLGFLCLAADATEEAALVAAGVARARALATVLPDDAANVFITLSARSLNRGLQIISRGEAPSTERKLIHAGADKVILPTHIGAERIAELILHPASAALLRGSAKARSVERSLRELGLEIEVVSAAEHSGVPGLTVEALERRAAGAFFVAQVDRPGGEPLVSPPGETVIQPGDGLVLVGRRIGAFGAAFGRTS